ncbi:hypothetical protein XFEB_01564 [Xylella fastidiosa EB92.1]|nr:hypothetical protein XFEB_01564 [Xylella fastidiosa EB92.1]
MAIRMTTRILCTYRVCNQASHKNDYGKAAIAEKNLHSTGILTNASGSFRKIKKHIKTKGDYLFSIVNHI